MYGNVVSMAILLITIVTDATSWINTYIPELIKRLIKRAYKVNWLHDVNLIEQGEGVFFLGCGQIAPSDILEKNKHNLVVHESDLPWGKGRSPLTW